MNVPVLSATTLDAALEALERATPDTRVLAGGTDLMVELESGRTRPDRVIDIWRVPDLRGIEREAGGLRIGALTDCATLVRSELIRTELDILAASADEVGAEQIKNRATIGGNLGTASPAADLNPVLVALDARVRLASTLGIRELPVEDFLTGYRQTARRPDELITSIWIPARPEGERRAFKKIGTRRAQSISKVVVALALCAPGETVHSLRAAAGSVAARTLRLETLERELTGKAIDRTLIARATRECSRRDAAPIDDVRSSADYRRTVLQRVLQSLLEDLLLPDLRP